jgi:hypothetical protein
MAATNHRIQSPIVVLHQRYEAATAEYQLIEKAERDSEDAFKIQQARRAGKSSCRETDALRLAILHQVPADWADTAILQYHIIDAFDMLVNCDDYPEADREALQTAIDTVFDFMCCEMAVDHERFGAAFKEGAQRAYFSRRFRTGLVEG